MKKIFAILLIGIGVYGYIQNNPSVACSFTQESIQSDQAITEAYQNQLSNIQISGSGKVIAFSVMTIKAVVIKDSSYFCPPANSLVAHNIDLAPKISTLQKGDVVQFFGEYKWNSKGGVIHWTHQDPDGRHISGWLKA